MLHARPSPTRLKLCGAIGERLGLVGVERMVWGRAMGWVEWGMGREVGDKPCRRLLATCDTCRVVKIAQRLREDSVVSGSGAALLVNRDGLQRAGAAAQEYFTFSTREQL